MSYVKLLMYPNFDFYNYILQFVLYLINIHQFGPKLECKSLNWEGDFVFKKKNKETRLWAVPRENAKIEN